MSERPLLLPFTPLYRLALAFRELSLTSGREPIRRLRNPVISIGNLSTGGSGKTPLSIALAQALTRSGVQVDVLSRGYRRQSSAPARVLPQGTAYDFGDEPLLIARATGLPVYVARQRYDAGLLAESTVPSTDSARPDLAAPIPSLHILDDGFQHRQLHRDLDILLVQLDDLCDRLLPAGNLREPLQAIARADILAVPATESEIEPELRAYGFQGPMWRIHRRMVVPSLDGPTVAFCGIARAEQFFAGLVSAGIQLAGRVAFRDHHRYTDHDIGRLVAAARSAKAAALLTTEKDAVRLGDLSAAFPPHLRLVPIPLRIEIDQEGAVLNDLFARITLATTAPHSSS